MSSQVPHEVELHLLSSLGESLTASVCPLVVKAVMYGLCIPIVLYYLRSIIRLHQFTKRTITALVISLIGCSLLTAHFCIDLLQNSIFVHASLIAHPELSIVKKQAYTNARLYIPNVLSTSIINLLPPLDDSIVVWRAWILFNQRKIFFIVPLFLLFSSYVVTIAYIISLSLTGPDTFVSAVLLEFTLPLTIATNLIATGLIIWRFWAHRRSLPPEMRASATTLKILLRLIESGALYCGLQLIYLFVAQFGSNHIQGSIGRMAEQVFLGIYFSVNGIYPTLVTLLVKNTGDDEAGAVINLVGREESEGQFQEDNVVGSSRSGTDATREGTETGGGKRLQK